MKAAEARNVKARTNVDVENISDSPTDEADAANDVTPTATSANLPPVRPDFSVGAATGSSSSIMFKVPAIASSYYNPAPIVSALSSNLFIRDEGTFGYDGASESLKRTQEDMLTGMSALSYMRVELAGVGRRLRVSEKTIEKLRRELSEKSRELAEKNVAIDEFQSTVEGLQGRNNLLVGDLEAAQAKVKGLETEVAYIQSKTVIATRRKLYKEHELGLSSQWDHGLVELQYANMMRVDSSVAGSSNARSAQGLSDHVADE